MTQLLERIDFHVHTNRSDCGAPELDLQRIVKEYEDRGFCAIGLVDHYYPAQGVTRFEQARDEIDHLNTSLQVFLSAEIEVVDDQGNLECSQVDLLKPVLDYISAAYHPHKFVKAGLVSEQQLPEYSHRAMMAVTENDEVDVILHPWDGGWTEIPPFDKLPLSWLQEFARSAARNSKIVEISNCFSFDWVPRTNGFTESYHLLVTELLHAQVGLIIGSDGHRLKPSEHGGASLCRTNWAVNTLRHAGGTDANITLPTRNEHR